MIPEPVSQARRNICRSCPQPCEALQRGEIAYADPCARCPLYRWHMWGCGLLPAAPGPTPARAPQGPRIGPGKFLATLIAKVTGAEPTVQCQCAARERQMDAWG